MLKSAGSVLAFDFGAVRTGVAVGETELCIAHPLQTILANSNEQCMAKVELLYQQWQPAHMVVGLPTHADGQEHSMTARAQKFARRLKGRFACQVWLVDERYSSELAKIMLEEAGVSHYKKQKLALDQVAAQAILVTWFDSGGEKI